MSQSSGHKRDSQGPRFPGTCPLCQPLPMCPSHWYNNFPAILQAEEPGIVLAGCGQLSWEQGHACRGPLGRQTETSKAWLPPVSLC